MRSTTIACAGSVALTVVVLGSQVESARAADPPRLSVEHSCAAAAKGAISIGRDQEACMRDERAAQDLLTKSWSQYSVAHKTQCVGMTTQGSPSYVELVTCIETMRDAAAIEKADALSDGAGAKSPPSLPGRRAIRGFRQ